MAFAARIGGRLQRSHPVLPIEPRRHAIACGGRLRSLSHRDLGRRAPPLRPAAHRAARGRSGPRELLSQRPTTAGGSRRERRRGSERPRRLSIALAHWYSAHDGGTMRPESMSDDSLADRAESSHDRHHRDDVTSRAATVNARKAIKVERSIQVRRSAEALYTLWRDFSNL